MVDEAYAERDALKAEVERFKANNRYHRGYADGEREGEIRGVRKADEEIEALKAQLAEATLERDRHDSQLKEAIEVLGAADAYHGYLPGDIGALLIQLTDAVREQDAPKRTGARPSKQQGRAGDGRA